MKCILNVTDHEYDRILQLTHDAVMWNNRDQHISQGIAVVLGSQVAAEIKRYDECRMEKHHDISDLPRVEPASDLVESTPTRIE